MGEHIEAAQVIDLCPCAVQKISAMDHDSEALRPANRDIEAIWIEQKL